MAPDSAEPTISEQLFEEMPSLARLYSRAVGRSGMLMLRRPGSRGDRLPLVGYRVEGVHADPEQLTAYQHLLGEPGTDILPAGYVHVLAFPLAMALMVREDFPLPVLGLVHVANRVTQHRPVRLGERLTVRAHATDLRPHRKGTQVDLVVTVAVDEETVWEGTSTYLAKGSVTSQHGDLDAATATGAAAGTGAGGGAGTATATDEQPLAAPGAEDRVKSGVDSAPDLTRSGKPAVTAGVWRLGADVGKRYAEISGDRNPIHVSRLGARIFGFPRPIAHGMYTAARALAAVGPARGENFTWEVEFAKPVLLPGRVQLTLEHDAGGYRFIGHHPRSGKVHLEGAVCPI